MVISGANRTDMKKLEALLDASFAPYPDDDPDQPTWHLALDRGYDYDACRRTAQDHHFVPHIRTDAAPKSESFARSCVAPKLQALTQT